ncbi:hypothetical protein ABT116_00855 [Streptomyces sp. NPDC002130]|uniref:hypothetical protein n=1 Tax=Streptomyces sp. NPDC002130 TaxID=3155568 RepID=UPI00331BEFFF
MKRTTAAAVSLLTVAALISAAGCSGTATASAGATAPPKRQPTPAERVTALLVGRADLGTGYSVREFDPAKGKSVFARSAREITGDGACIPLAAMTHQLPLGRPQASLSRVVSTEEAPGTRIYVTLATYDQGMAMTAMNTLLEDAVQGCSLGFSVKANGHGELYYPFEPEETPDVGDEALAYRGMITEEGGGSRPIRTTVVRHGDAIVVCTAVGGAYIARPRLLAPVLEAQDAKLR